MDYKQLESCRQLWTNRKIIAVAKPFETKGISEGKAFAQYLLGREVSAKMHHTRKNAIHGHTFLWSFKFLQQLFYYIHSETLELISARSSEH